MDPTYDIQDALSRKVGNSTNQSWVREVTEGKDNNEKGDVLDSRSVPDGTAIRTRKFGYYVLTKHAGDGQLFKCVSHPELGDWTSLLAFEAMLIASPSIPTGRIGPYYYIQGSDQAWVIYKQSNGYPVPQELAIRFSDEQELQLAVHRFNGEDR